VVVMGNTKEADLAAHRAAGRIGPNTIIVEIATFGDEAHQLDSKGTRAEIP
jgi:hypothetical protein